MASDISGQQLIQQARLHVNGLQDVALGPHTLAFDVVQGEFVQVFHSSRGTGLPLIVKLLRLACLTAGLL